jgi:DNA-binding response OmpR family regulator
VEQGTPKILIIEDDVEASQLLERWFGMNGYATVVARTGPDGLVAARTEHPDVVLLDLMLPYKSGDEILREVRSSSDVPIIVVSAKDTSRVKVDLLRAGADDYVTKPFDIDELLARVESALRRGRTAPRQRGILRAGDIVLDVDSRSIAVAGAPMVLTATEFDILHVLMEKPDRVWSKKALFERVWGEDYFSDDKTVATHVGNLRRKLRAAGDLPDYIGTVWGIGYRFRA